MSDTNEADTVRAKGELQCVCDRLRELASEAESSGNRLESYNLILFGSANKVVRADNEAPKHPEEPDNYFIKNMNRQLTHLHDAMDHIRSNLNKLGGETDDIAPFGPDEKTSIEKTS